MMLLASLPICVACHSHGHSSGNSHSEMEIAFSSTAVSFHSTRSFHVLFIWNTLDVIRNDMVQSTVRTLDGSSSPIVSFTLHPSVNQNGVLRIVKWQTKKVPQNWNSFSEDDHISFLGMEKIDKQINK